MIYCFDEDWKQKCEIVRNSTQWEKEQENVTWFCIEIFFSLGCSYVFCFIWNTSFGELCFSDQLFNVTNIWSRNNYAKSKGFILVIAKINVIYINDCKEKVCHIINLIWKNKWKHFFYHGIITGRVVCCNQTSISQSYCLESIERYTKVVLHNGCLQWVRTVRLSLNSNTVQLTCFQLCIG